MLAFALACALWDHDLLSKVAQTLQVHQPHRTACAHLFRCSPFATPCRINDLIEELASIQQELDRTKQELQASSERNIVLSQQLGVTQDHLRAAERSGDDYRAQLQQVGLPLCSATQCWAGPLVEAPRFALSWKCSGLAQLRQ